MQRPTTKKRPDLINTTLSKYIESPFSFKIDRIIPDDLLLASFLDIVSFGKRHNYPQSLAPLSWTNLFERGQHYPLTVAGYNNGISDRARNPCFYYAANLLTSNLVVLSAPEAKVKLENGIPSSSEFFQTLMPHTVTNSRTAMIDVIGLKTYSESNFNDQRKAGSLALKLVQNFCDDHIKRF